MILYRFTNRLILCIRRSRKTQWKEDHFSQLRMVIRLRWRTEDKWTFFSYFVGSPLVIEYQVVPKRTHRTTFTREPYSVESQRSFSSCLSDSLSNYHYYFPQLGRRCETEVLSTYYEWLLCLSVYFRNLCSPVRQDLLTIRVEETWRWSRNGSRLVR